MKPTNNVLPSKEDLEHEQDYQDVIKARSEGVHTMDKINEVIAKVGLKELGE